MLTLIVLYTGMLVFDFSMLVGTAWLVSERGWSGWWFALAVFMCMGSSPKTFIDAWKKGESK